MIHTLLNSDKTYENISHFESVDSVTKRNQSSSRSENLLNNNNTSNPNCSYTIYNFD